VRGARFVIVAGIDIGAATAKAVIYNENKIVSFSIIPTGSHVAGASEEVLNNALRESELYFRDLVYVISTGYGRRAVSFRNKSLTEIICHAAGVSWMVPHARTVIDIGGQDSKVIGLDKDGNVNNFVMNDKCAAGTGRFLEVMAGVLDVDVSDMGPISLEGAEPCPISSTCTVFAESEMVTLRAEGNCRENIIAGIHKATAHRVAIMGKTVGFNEVVVFTGGVGKNSGMKKAMEDIIKMDIFVPEEPQIMGALGAALLARNEAIKEA